jgi:hypothetical protein
MTALPKAEQRRAQIRDALLEHTSEIQYLARAVGYRLEAADVESALVYLRELRGLVDETLVKCAPRRSSKPKR